MKDIWFSKRNNFVLIQVVFILKLSGLEIKKNVINLNSFIKIIKIHPKSNELLKTQNYKEVLA